MDAFSAVVTTGIYCRPGCPARPHAENVRTFPLAAAAEAAGYRACHRCRPYRWPQSLDWTAPELVCRAVRLILDGVLDRGSEAELGARLGISPRHLRRLFSAHLGVTPDGLARSARAHFARRLLDETDLTITQVAFAAGFRSVRQFNRACREVFREPPRALRARRRAADRLVADGGLVLQLPFNGPLAWDATLAQLAADAIPGVEFVAGTTYRRTITLAGDPGMLELLPGGEGHLLMRAHLPHWEELVHVVQRARRIANLDLDLDGPTRELTRDPTIAALLNARPGLRPAGAWDPFETGLVAIVGQHATRARGRRNVAQLVERFGTPVPGLSRLSLTHTFPTAATLAEVDLGDLGLAATKAAAIRGFAASVADGRIRLDNSVGLDQLVASITAVDGLRPSTAHYIALRLGEPDAFPVSRTPLERLLRAGAAPNTATIGSPSKSWRPWRALVAIHLSLAHNHQYSGGALPHKVQDTA